MRVTVFPASAGAFLNRLAVDHCFCGLPRLGGGVSITGDVGFGAMQSSPPRRGCFRAISPVSGSPAVFPASAGVFLTGGLFALPRTSLPRLGGGVSFEDGSSFGFDSSSPPRRGCFRLPAGWGAACAVFPASAGVFLDSSGHRLEACRLPRLGGGVSVLLIL